MVWPDVAQKRRYPPGRYPMTYVLKPRMSNDWAALCWRSRGWMYMADDPSGTWWYMLGMRPVWASCAVMPVAVRMHSVLRW